MDIFYKIYGDGTYNEIGATIHKVGKLKKFFNTKLLTPTTILRLWS